MGRLTVPLTSVGLILGIFSVIRWTKFRRSGEKIRLQFYLGDYLVSLACIGVCALTVHCLKRPWGIACSAQWLFTGAAVVGLINGKVWHLTKREKNGIPDSAYLAIGVGAGILSAMASEWTYAMYGLGPIFNATDFLIVLVPLVVTIIILGGTSFTITNRFREENSLPPMQWQTSDLIISSLCVATTGSIVHGLAHGNSCEECLAMILFVLAAIFGLANGKWWSLLKCSSGRVNTAAYLLLGFLSSISLALISGVTFLFIYLLYFYGH